MVENPHYNTLRYRKRMADLKNLLGGECKKCGAKEKLEFHHMDPAQKSFNPSSEFDRPWDQLLEEIKKCELRCSDCHKLEHPAKHGLGMYTHQKCRCDICRAVWAAKTRQYKAAARIKNNGA